MVVEIQLAWNIKSNIWKWTSLPKIIQFFLQQLINNENYTRLAYDPLSVEQQLLLF